MRREPGGKGKSGERGEAVYLPVNFAVIANEFSRLSVCRTNQISIVREI